MFSGERQVCFLATSLPSGQSETGGGWVEVQGWGEAPSFTLSLTSLRALCLICVTVNMKTLCSLDFSVSSPHLVFVLSLCKPCWARLPLFFSINFLQSFHPSPGLPQETGSRWISLGAKYTVCACQSLPYVPVVSLPEICVLFLCVGGRGGVYPTVCNCTWWLALFLLVNVPHG